MKTQVSFHHIQPASHASLERSIGELAARHLERHLSGYGADTVVLYVHLEKRGRHDHYHAGVQLTLPGATLVSGADDQDLMVALRKAFDDVERATQKRKGDD